MKFRCRRYSPDGRRRADDRAPACAAAGPPGVRRRPRFAVPPLIDPRAFRSRVLCFSAADASRWPARSGRLRRSIRGQRRARAVRLGEPRGGVAVRAPWVPRVPARPERLRARLGRVGPRRTGAWGRPGGWGWPRGCGAVHRRRLPRRLQRGRRAGSCRHARRVRSCTAASRGPDDGARRARQVPRGGVAP